jgi:hypothetical protein
MNIMLVAALCQPVHQEQMAPFLQVAKLELQIFMGLQM